MTMGSSETDKNQVDLWCGKDNSTALKIEATLDTQYITFEKDKVIEWSGKGYLEMSDAKTICLKRRMPKRNIFDISQRGIMLKVKDDQLTTDGDNKTLSNVTSWSKLNGTLSSIPFSGQKIIEQWFTVEHIHD